MHLHFRKLIRPAVALLLFALVLSSREVPAQGSDAISHDSRIPDLSAVELAELPPDGGPDYNRLIFEKSPYLLMHATNPVDWWPWSDAAFEHARSENKPVFLSIGYSTCHWCHVMERESFEAPEVAAVINEHFVAVKVDREERPDIDEIYMAVTQAMNEGQGGWPMTVLLTPGRHPFFAGTYFPKEPRFGKPGLMQLLPRVAELWQTDRERLSASASQITQALQATMTTAAADLTTETLATAVAQIRSAYDPDFGGFGDRNKFPAPHYLRLLLRDWRRTGDEESLRMVTYTLDQMRRGGIYDQLGGGFHRYAVDSEWRVPHFEKMLYDQALIAEAYLEAYQATGREEFAGTAREIFDYVLRDLTSPEGAFYSAEDAESEGVEGRFYLWRYSEIENVLGAEKARLFADAYGVERGGNFTELANTSDTVTTGSNVLYRARTAANLARDFDATPEEIEARLDEIRAELLSARNNRPRPLRDDKVLTDWNGLMIGALARGGRVLDESRYTDAAVRAADFILAELTAPDASLLHRWRAGDAGIDAMVADYAYLASGLIDLYETTFEIRYLRSALDLTERMLADFGAEDGGLYLTTADQEGLIVRPRSSYDGDRPAAGSVAALNLLRLARLTGEVRFEERAEAFLSAMGGVVAEQPSAFAHLLLALDFALGPSFEIVIAGAPDAADTQSLLRALDSAFVPNHVLLLRPPNSADDQPPPITDVAPYTLSFTPLDGRAAAYVCQDFACSAPTTDPAAMLDLLRLGQRNASNN